MSEKEMSGVFQLENGYWGYRFIVSVNGRRKTQKRILDEMGKPFKTQKQAYEARKEAIIIEKYKLQNACCCEKIKKTVEEVYREYCEKGRYNKAYTTKKKQDSLWNNYIAERFGNRYVDEIFVGEVNDYLAELYCVYHLAYGYVEGFLKLFYLIFGQAYSRGYLSLDEYNRLCVIKNGKIHMPMKKSVDVKEIVSYSKEEIQILDAYFAGKTVETAYIIGKYSGLRIAECYGLTWDCIDLEAGIITVEKQMQTQDGIIKLVPLKTINARRNVYMHEELQKYLSDLKEKIKHYKKQFALQREQNEKYILNVDERKISSLELVNTLPNGRIQTEYAIKHHARPIKNLFNIEFKFHYLRHTYGTNLALLNTPAHVLSNQMGHSKSSTTHKYYLAVSEQAVEEFRNNLNQI